MLGSRRHLGFGEWQASDVNDSVMEPDLVTEGRLLGVLHELMKREPIFDRREVVSCLEDFERETAEDYWETGASGRRYNRAFVWATLEERLSADRTPT